MIKYFRFKMYLRKEVAIISIFTIVEKKYGDDGYYTLRDSSGNIIKVNFGDACYLYDSQEWVKWKERNSTEYKNLSEANIKCLEEKIELLKDILVKQGIRIVTQEHANKLGL